MNAGKFPSASEAHKHVGGSYYIIRELVQELEHKAEVPTLSRNNENLMKTEPSEERKSLAKAEVSTSQRTADSVIQDCQLTAPISPLEIPGASSNLQIKRGKWVEKILSEEVTTSVSIGHLSHLNHIV